MRRTVVPLLAICGLLGVIAGLREARVAARVEAPERWRPAAIEVEPLAVIRVESWSGAQVALDGISRGRIAAGQRELTIRDVQPGRHMLRVAVPHLQAWVELIQVRPGEILSRRVMDFGPPINVRQFDAEPSSARSPELGVLHMSTDPQECVIYCETLDWQERRKSRPWFVATNIPPGKHLIVFTTESDWYSQEVTVVAGKVKRVEIDIRAGKPLTSREFAGGRIRMPREIWQEWGPEEEASPEPAVFTVSASYDGSRVVTCDRRYQVRLWEVGSEARSRLIATAGDSSTAAAISREGNRIAASDWFHRVWVYDVASNRRIATFDGARGAVNSVVLDSRGELVAAADSAGYVQVWEVDQGRLLWQRRVGEYSADHLAVGGRGTSLVIATNWPRPLQICDFQTGENIRNLTSGGTSILRVAASDDPPVVLALQVDGKVLAIDSTSGRKIEPVLPGYSRGDFAGPYSVLSGSPGGAFAVMVPTGIQYCHLPDATIHRVGRETSEGATALALSGDGKRLVVGRLDGSIVVLNLK